MTAMVLLQSAGAGGAAALVMQVLPIVAIGAIFYFLVIAPANKQRRQTQDMLAALKKGDRVLTTGGLYGTVQGIENDVVYLKVAENVKLKVARSAISSLVNDSSVE